MSIVGFDMCVLQVKWNIFVAAQDALPKERKPQHRLPLKDYEYENFMVLKKTILCIANGVFLYGSAHLPVSVDRRRSANEEDLFGKYSTNGVKVGDVIEQW